MRGYFDTESLRIAIIELKGLIKELDAEEEKFQSWFERNPVAFSALGFNRWIPHPSIDCETGEKFIPDFIVEDFYGIWRIFGDMEDI